MPSEAVQHVSESISELCPLFRRSHTDPDTAVQWSDAGHTNKNAPVLKCGQNGTRTLTPADINGNKIGGRRQGCQSVLFGKAIIFLTSGLYFCRHICQKGGILEGGQRRFISK